MQSNECYDEVFTAKYLALLCSVSEQDAIFLGLKNITFLGFFFSFKRSPGVFFTAAFMSSQQVADAVHEAVGGKLVADQPFGADSHDASQTNSSFRKPALAAFDDQYY
jgi:hypothetical protein